MIDLSKDYVVIFIYERQTTRAEQHDTKYVSKFLHNDVRVPVKIIIQELMSLITGEADSEIQTGKRRTAPKDQRMGKLEI